ncbi:MAG: DUF3667 domain-containing protein [Sphingomicrobium sp.]
MSEVEGIGEIVTGAALAVAVEPTAGGESERRDGACLNCSTPLIGTFCAACGQKARVHRSLRGFGADFIAGLFNFEGKFWRTLPMLGWRPGELTRRYISGERARFISPVALYLFSVFLMFAVLSFSGMIGGDNIGGSVKNNLAEAVSNQREVIVKLEAERRSVVGDAARLAKIDRQLAAEKEDLAGIERVRVGGPLEADGLNEPGVPPLLRETFARVQANPEKAVTSVQDAASKYSWLLIPLSIPFMWLLFPFNRRYRLYDHTVFVTYSLSFMMMLVILAGLLISIGWTPVAAFLWFVPPIHMYWQLRGAYQLGWFSALIRATALIIFCFIASLLFAMVIAAIGVL